MPGTAFFAKHIEEAPVARPLIFHKPLMNEPPAIAGSRARKCGAREWVKWDLLQAIFSFQKIWGIAWEEGIGNYVFFCAGKRANFGSCCFHSRG